MSPLSSHGPPLSLDLDALREKLARQSGPLYWRSLDELAQTDEFADWLRREFPRQAGEWSDEIGRRTFLKLMAASLALAGATSGCTHTPPESIVPYVRQPLELTPGRPLFFATAFLLGGYALGVLAESHEGRPTKLEGNPDHPASQGGTNPWTQASVLSLYDPDRSQVPLHRGRIATWERFAADLAGVRRRAGDQGAGLRVLIENTTSPTLLRQLTALFERWPDFRWSCHEPVGRDAVYAGARLALGEPREPVYHFDTADIVLALDADFLVGLPGSVRYARDFIDRRRVVERGPKMNRLYSVEPRLSCTGAVADHRLALRASDVEQFARELAHRLEVGGTARAPSGALAEVSAQWWKALVSDLKANRGRSLVLAGDQQTPATHALAFAINRELGNFGQTVEFREPISPTAGGPLKKAGLIPFDELVGDMQAGKVQQLFILGGNPVYNAPGSIEFAAALKKVDFKAHHSPYADETSFLCEWHLPAAHALESWSDSRAFEGRATIQQPLIAPLYSGRTSHEVLHLLTGEAPLSDFELVRQTWIGTQDGNVSASAKPVSQDATRPGDDGPQDPKDEEPGDQPIVPPGQPAAKKDFARRWQEWLQRGVVDEELPSAGEPTWKWTDRVGAASSPDDSRSSSGGEPAAGPHGPQAWELVFRPDSSAWDGRFANNGWLQELPRQITKLCWDNAALVSPESARRLGAVNGDVVEITLGKQSVRIPVWIVPGHADGTLTLPLGYGRTRAGHVGTGVGVDVYPLLPGLGRWHVTGATVRTVAERRKLVTTQTMQAIDPVDQQTLERRELIRVYDLQHLPPSKADQPGGPAHEGNEDVKGGHQGGEGHPSLYPNYDYSTGNSWGMVIDQTACIGCQTCVIACQAENNTPVVGKDQVAAGRAMHWLRVDEYYSGDPFGNPDLHFQPVPCMQCEKAPCELVCPVAATVHSSEGLNDMVYNRCIGTRYCANNCPYKVRRFNFLQYSDLTTPSLKLLNNPDVTVRTRGVMEKCTYCVQRINAVRIDSKVRQSPIRDGELQTACQQACPVKAISFGNLNDPDSAVRRHKASPLNYALLEELGTLPRTTYLGRVRNPHPLLAERETTASATGHAAHEPGPATASGNDGGVP